MSIRSRRRSKRSARIVFEHLDQRLLLSAAAPLTNLGLYQASSSSYSIDLNFNGQATTHFYALPTDKLVFGDFNGDTITDVAAYRPTTGEWWVDTSTSGTPSARYVFGGPGLTPVTGDVNGDGYSDLGTYNPSTGVWQFDTNRDGVADITVHFGGAAGDIPLMGDFNNDGKADLVIYNQNTGVWSIDTNLSNPNGEVDQTYQFGGPGWTPFVSDVNRSGAPNLGIYNNGTWLFDFYPYVNGVASSIYRFGNSSYVPITGYFDSSNSLFVSSVTGSDSNPGTLTAPFATINKAISAATSGENIRIGAGLYPENAYLYGQSNVSFIGAGQNATHIDPSNGDALFLDTDTNIWIDGVNFDGLGSVVNSTSGTQGRGLVLFGSSASIRHTSTTGSRAYGVLTASSGSNLSTLNAAFAHFDATQIGNGLDMQSGTTANISNCSFNSNGYLSSQIPGTNNTNGGRGFVIEATCTATIGSSTFDYNYNGGAFTRNQSATTFTGCEFSYNVQGNGGLILDQSTVSVNSSMVQGNGTVRTLASGYNGFEVYENFTGTASFTGNTFYQNTASGLQLNGPNITVSSNWFYNNLVGINVNGVFVPPITTTTYAGKVTNPIITGNTFQVLVGSTVEEGVFGLGSGAEGTIGGAGNLGNTFMNYHSLNAIDQAKTTSQSPGTDYGAPLWTISTNNYVNSPNPIRPPQ